MADPGSLKPGIPFSRHLWAAQAKVWLSHRNFQTSAKRLMRWSQKAQDTAPASETNDRSALPTNPVESTALRMRAMGIGNGVTPQWLSMELVPVWRRCQPYAPEEQDVRRSQGQ